MPAATVCKWPRTQFSRPLFSKTTKKNTANVPLEPGEYYWRVGAVPKKGKAVAWYQVDKIHVHGGKPGIKEARRA
ncbi:MAG: hypothetical protein R3B54_15720 [Bdellovibrionota bacterium]